MPHWNVFPSSCSFSRILYPRLLKKSQCQRITELTRLILCFGDVLSALTALPASGFHYGPVSRVCQLFVNAIGLRVDVVLGTSARVSVSVRAALDFL